MPRIGTYAAPTTYPSGDKSLKFGKLMSEMSFIAIEDVVLFVCVLNTDKRPKNTWRCEMYKELMKMFSLRFHFVVI